MRTELLRALRALGADLDASGVAVLTAHRGSTWSAAVLHPDKVPWEVRVDLEDTVVGDRPGCVVRFAVAARWPSSAPFPAAAAGAYGDAFTSVGNALDAALRRLAPGSTFDALELVGATTGRAQPSAVRSGANAAAKIGRLLEGRAAPTQVSGDVLLVCGTRVAAFDLQTLYLMTTVGVGVTARPGAMPRPLVAQVADLTARLDARLAGADPSLGPLRIEIGTADVPVVEFLHLQARLRNALPLRTLQVCTACRLEKVVNPDYQRLQARTRRKNLLTGSLGGAVSSHGVSPFLLVGRLLQLKSAGADEFVCPRCQGLDADETIVTFCPECGDRRAESALRVCPRCSHDFRRDVPAVALWVETGEPVPVESVVSPAPAETPEPSEPQVMPSPVIPSPAEPSVPAGDGWSAPAAHGYAPPSAGVSTKGLRALLGRAEPAPAPSHPPGWYADPAGAPVWRWWDGAAWTEHVSSGS